MTLEENVTVVRHYHDLLAHFDGAAAEAIWADEIVFREPQQVLRGSEAGKARFRAFLAAFPDLAAALHEEVAQDDKAAVRYTLPGTHRGPFAGGREVVVC